MITRSRWNAYVTSEWRRMTRKVDSYDVARSIERRSDTMFRKRCQFGSVAGKLHYKEIKGVAPAWERSEQRYVRTMLWSAAFLIYLHRFARKAVKSWKCGLDWLQGNSKSFVRSFSVSGQDTDYTKNNVLITFPVEVVVMNLTIEGQLWPIKNRFDLIAFLSVAMHTYDPDRASSHHTGRSDNILNNTDRWSGCQNELGSPGSTNYGNQDELYIESIKYILEPQQAPVNVVLKLFQVKRKNSCSSPPWYHAVVVYWNRMTRYTNSKPFCSIKVNCKMVGYNEHKQMESRNSTP